MISMNRRKSVAAAFCLSAFLIQAAAQTIPPSRTPEFSQSPGLRGGSIFRSRQVSDVSYANSPRTYQLIRAGNMYLSLQDALALALENNLDIQVQRYNPLIAGTETQRAQGGGLLRGLQFTIRELPQGVGGPGGPLLTTLGATNTLSQLNAGSADLAIINEQVNDLSVQSTIPYSNGSPIPAFDSLFNLGVNGSHNSVPQPSIFSSGTPNFISTQVNGSGAFQQAFSTGTLVNAGYTSNRFDTNSTQTDYNPYTTASLSFTVTQPLLQGFGIDVNRRFIKIAVNEQRIASLIFNEQLITALASVIRLYWDLVSLQNDVGVKTQALNAAQRLYNDNQQQVSVGTLAPLQLTRAAAEVARAKQDLINSQSLVDQQEVIFKNVLTRTGADDPSLEQVRIIPLDHIVVPAQEQEPPVADLILEALRNRPDLEQAKLQIANAGLSLKGSKNELLPQLNLVGGATNNALAGSVNPAAQYGALPGTPHAADPFLLGGGGTLLSQIFQRNFPDYSIGFQLNIPLRNRVAQADVARDQLQLRQSQVRLKQTENQVRVEVENAYVALQRSRASYDAAVETRQLQEQALSAEQQRLAVGQSTSFFVIQYERDLAQARSTAVVAEGNYAKARAALDRAIGRTLAVNNISLTEAASGIVTRPASALPPVPNNQ